MQKTPDAEGEARYVIVGESAATDILFVVYIEYIDDEIHIISAREASPKQQRDYLARRYGL